MKPLLISNLKRIDSAKFRLKDWSREMLEKVKTDFTYYSNKIEGNALTYGETIAILKENIKPKNKSLQDIFSVKNHKKFVDLLFKSYKTDFSLAYIKDLHFEYMNSIFQWAEGTGDNYSPGVLKWDTNGTIRPNGEYKTYMGAKETPGEVEKLCELVNNQLKKSGILNEKPFIWELKPNYRLILTIPYTVLFVFSPLLAILAILVACLGLFGLATFSVEQRTEEIGVRKVLGISTAQIMQLLSREFMILICISFLIAIPLAYYSLNEWLNGFAFRIDIQAWLFILAGVMTFLISAATVVFHALKASYINPKDTQNMSN